MEERDKAPQERERQDSVADAWAAVVMVMCAVAAVSYWVWSL